MVQGQGYVTKFSLLAHNSGQKLACVILQIQLKCKHCICSHWLSSFHHNIEYAAYDISDDSRSNITILNETSYMSSYICHHFRDLTWFSNAPNYLKLGSGVESLNIYYTVEKTCFFMT